MSGITIKHGQELQSNVSNPTQSGFYPKYVEGIILLLNSNLFSNKLFYVSINQQSHF